MEIKKSLDYLVRMMGGKVSPHISIANTIVFYKDASYSRKHFAPPTVVKVHYSWIFECYFACGLLDLTEFDIQGDK